MELSTKDAAYLKMSAQRERSLVDSQQHLENVLKAVAEDHGFDEKDFMEKYNHPAHTVTKMSLLRHVRVPKT